MSVLSRAAAPPATHEVAAAVAALLTNLDPNAPATLFAAESPAPLDDSRLDESDAAEAHGPRRLLGPSGLGAPAVTPNLPTLEAIAQIAQRAGHPPAPSGGAVAPPHTAQGRKSPPGPIPRSFGSGGLPAPPAAGGSPTPPETHLPATSPMAAAPPAGATASRPPKPAGPTGVGTGSTYRRPIGTPVPGESPAPTNSGAAEPTRPGRMPQGPNGLGSTSAHWRRPNPPQDAPAAPTSPAARADTVVEADAAAPAVATSVAAAPGAPSAVDGAGRAAWEAAGLLTGSGSSGGQRQVAHGPSGIGTTFTRRKAKGQVIPALYCPPPVRDDPVLAAAVNEGILAWAQAIGLYEGRLDELRKADFGRLIMLAHPDCDDADRLLAVAKCAVSEWSVDDYYCEEDASDIAPDGTRSSAAAELGPRLELAAATMDPVFLPARYQAQVEQALQSDPILRAFRTSFEHLAQFASPAQVARLRTEIAGWFIALGAEAGWRMAGRMPPVWEYLLNRQPHSFLPCMAPLDAVGGYELLAAEYTDPRVRKVTTTAALASQMVNDLYSMAREDLSDGREFNLPTVLAAEEQCSRREAVQRTAEVHDELVHRFEAEAGALAATGSPELRRFLGGLWAWMGGNRAWHADSRRYNERN
ncbi:family 2 encapsulin nanocompartment cargo protein terpene cyclase [Nocardia sp. NPDC088792]|uniref:family 2 encapsulin nanocompartment cargo protein terpene cyclase n=1 Tax=Nocardia sp. NPDC088792 TaxID=3364332 RepID=UPI0037FA574F